MRPDELAQRLRVSRHERRDFDVALAALERSGEVVRNRAGALLVEVLERATGESSAGCWCLKDARCCCWPEDRHMLDILIPPIRPGARSPAKWRPSN